MTRCFGLIVLALWASNSGAANLYAGQSRAESVCSQCHGLKTPPKGSIFLPLAGRDASYLKLALQQYRDKTRKSDIMNAIAGSLSDADIEDVMTYYSKQRL
jgi:cytochrome c553